MDQNNENDSFVDFLSGIWRKFTKKIEDLGCQNTNLVQERVVGIQANESLNVAQGKNMKSEEKTTQKTSYGTI